ncbi:MAG: diacylglycerol kinase family protein [Bacillota bacterium]
MERARCNPVSWQATAELKPRYYRAGGGEKEAAEKLAEAARILNELGGSNTIHYKTAFIINPQAGKGRSLRVWRRLEAVLKAEAQPYSVFYTRFQGDGSNIAEQMRAKGIELVVGVGGDGTLLEIINGLDLKNNIFGIIPAGTGNGFRRSLKIPGNPRKALAGLSKWEPRQVDLGIINGYYFLNVVGFGFDAAVAKLATVDNRVMRGYPAYVIAFLAKLANFESFPITITCGSDTIREEKTFMAVISNGRYYGGQLCIAPQARLDDGRLDLCLLQKTGYLQTTTLAVKVFFRQHLNHKSMYIAQYADLFVDTAASVPVHIDGEIMGSLPAKIGISPRALSVLAPPA